MSEQMIETRIVFQRPRVRVLRCKLIAKRYVCYEVQLREHSCQEKKRWVTVEAYDYWFNARRVAIATHEAFDGTPTKAVRK